MSWTVKATPPHPAGTTAPNMVSIGSKLYAIGGYVSSPLTSQNFFEWDQATNVWTQKANIPVGFSNAAVASVGTKIYVTGQSNFGGNRLLLYEWDQATNTWTAKANGPWSASGYPGAGCSVGGSFYVLMDDNYSNFLGPFFRYDPSTNTWATLTSLPTSRIELASLAVVGTGIYVASGYSFNGDVDPLYPEADPNDANPSEYMFKYDTLAGTWSVASFPMPIKRNGFPGAAGFSNKYIFVAGGSGQGIPSLDMKVAVFDVTTNKWVLTDSLPVVVNNGTGVAAIGDLMYVLDVNSTSRGLYELKFVAPSSGDAWYIGKSGVWSVGTPYIGVNGVWVKG